MLPKSRGRSDHGKRRRCDESLPIVAATAWVSNKIHPPHQAPVEDEAPKKSKFSDAAPEEEEKATELAVAPGVSPTLTRFRVSLAPERALAESGPGGAF